MNSIVLQARIEKIKSSQQALEVRKLEMARMCQTLVSQFKLDTWLNHVGLSVAKLKKALDVCRVMWFWINTGIVLIALAYVLTFLCFAM
jgi:hypothetical protein